MNVFLVRAPALIVMPTALTRMEDMTVFAPTSIVHASRDWCPLQPPLAPVLVCRLTHYSGYFFENSQKGLSKIPVNNIPIFL